MCWCSVRGIQYSDYNYSCNGVEWSKDKTQAAESIKWRPQQAYGSNQFLLVQPQTVFSTPQPRHQRAAHQSHPVCLQPDSVNAS